MHHHRPYRPGCSRFASTWPAIVADPPRPLPVPEFDRIDTAAAALTLIDSVVSKPPVHETLAILLDSEYRGLTIVNIDATLENDSVLRIADLITEMAHRVNDIGAVIIASCRPGSSDELDDLDRWLTIDEQLGLVGIELVEWFVIGRSVSCPRSLFGDPARWAA